MCASWPIKQYLCFNKIEQHYEIWTRASQGARCNHLISNDLYGLISSWIICVHNMCATTINTHRIKFELSCMLCSLQLRIYINYCGFWAVFYVVYTMAERTVNLIWCGEPMWLLDAASERWHLWHTALGLRMKLMWCVWLLPLLSENIPHIMRWRTKETAVFACHFQLAISTEYTIFH